MQRTLFSPPDCPIEHQSLQSIEDINSCLSRGSSTGWVLASNQAAINNVEVIPDTGRTFVFTGSSAKTSSHFLDHLRAPAAQFIHDLHIILGLCSEASDTLSLDERLVGSWINQVGENCRPVTNRGHDSAITPDLSGDLLKRSCGRVVDQGSMSGRGVEEPVLGAVHLRSLRHVVKLLAEVAVGVVPNR
ncbi:hypothetical protein HG530_013667 [Fusarium avenaceum]|nr:hypothetical protein HG530_013667 [Fusarium avenaceum]